MHIGITRKQWQALAESYHATWGARLHAVNATGKCIYGKPDCLASAATACRQARLLAVQEALRWGDPTIAVCPRKRLIWAMPLMHNEKLTGGLVASIAEIDYLNGDEPLFDIRRACTDLRQRVENANLTNASALRTNRSIYLAEQGRACAIHTEEVLDPWLAATMGQMMDAIPAQRRGPRQALFDAMYYMQRHCSEKLSRNIVAKAVHISPSHFSFIIRRESGMPFTELLNRLRIDRAVQLLQHTTKPIALVALECGFEDQSYFTKVFQRYRKCTPGHFRKTPEK